MKHALHRTSPKGTPFVGTCSNCGRSGLSLDDMAVQECDNVRGLTQEQTLLEAIKLAEGE